MATGLCSSPEEAVRLTTHRPGVRWPTRTNVGTPIGDAGPFRSSRRGDVGMDAQGAAWLVESKGLVEIPNTWVGVPVELAAYVATDRVR